jgi:hypothetical protein
MESAGISDSAGGFHAVSSNDTAELPGGAGAGARSSVHAASSTAATAMSDGVASANVARRVGDIGEIERIAG